MDLATFDSIRLNSKANHAKHLVLPGISLLYPSIKYKELEYELQRSPHQYNAWKFAKTPRHYVNVSNRAHLGSGGAHEQPSIAI